jgi:hypothetical protein
MYVCNYVQSVFKFCTNKIALFVYLNFFLPHSLVSVKGGGGGGKIDICPAYIFFFRRPWGEPAAIRGSFHDLLSGVRVQRGSVGGIKCV